jgi:anaerobic selenocysteine-containing dehydrogenase
LLSTGRDIYQFHTRTKTGRSPKLNDAAPKPYIEIHPDDAKELNVSDCDMLEVVSLRGTVQAPARLGGVLRGHLFMPFHYGYWDEPGSDGAQPDGKPRAANELTITSWDPVSKQPHFKYAAVQVTKLSAKSIASSVGNAVHHAADRTSELATATGGSRFAGTVT